MNATPTAHYPRCSGPHGHSQTSDEHRTDRWCGPLYCPPCSQVAGEWVTWTPHDSAVGSRLRAMADEWDATAARLDQTGSGEDFAVAEVLSACASKIRAALDGGVA